MIGFSIIWTNERQAQIHFVSSLIRVVCRSVLFCQLLSQYSGALGALLLGSSALGGLSCLVLAPQGGGLSCLLWCTGEGGSPACFGALGGSPASSNAMLPFSGALRLFNTYLAWTSIHGSFCSAHHRFLHLLGYNTPNDKDACFFLLLLLLPPLFFFFFFL